MFKYIFIFLTFCSLNSNAGVTFSNGKTLPTITDSNGNVGISTTSPVNTFSVVNSTGSFILDSKNHILSGGAVPIIQNCGTSPTISANATDMTGNFTVGSGTPRRTCNIVFANGFNQAPQCFIMPMIAISGTDTILTTTASSFTVQHATDIDGLTFGYFCIENR